MQFEKYFSSRFSAGGQQGDFVEILGAFQPLNGCQVEGDGNAQHGGAATDVHGSLAILHGDTFQFRGKNLIVGAALQNGQQRRVAPVINGVVGVQAFSE